MSPVSALLDSDVRALATRAPSDESRHTSEATFQDAVDSRRAERAHAPAQDEDTRAKGDTKERVSARDARTRDGGPDEADERGAEAESRPDAPEESTPDSRAERDDSRPRRGEHARSAASDGSTGRPSSRGAKGTDRAASTASRGEAVDGVLPWFAHSALGGVNFLALPLAAARFSTGDAGTLAGFARGSVATDAQSAHRSASQPSGASPKATSAVEMEAAPKWAIAAFGPEALATQDAPRSSTASPAPAVDARGASAALSAPQAPETAVARELPAARSTPEDFPSFLGRLAVRMDAPERRAVVELEPAELGRLSISLSLESEGHVRAEVRAHRPEGYAALEARLPELQASLIERGFASASVNLSLGLADSRSRRSGTESGSSRSSAAGEKTLADAEIQALLAATPRARGAIDLWA